MKKSLFLVLFSIIAFSFSVQAQDDFSSSRLNNLSNQLKRHTVDLVDQTYNDLRRGNANSRREVEAAFLAQQFDAGAGLFQQMVQDNLRASDLRDATSILKGLAGRAPNFGASGNLWREARTTVEDIERELGGSGGGNTGGGDTGGSRTGTAFWRGTVDSKVQLVIRDRSIETQTITGRAYPAGTFSFTNSMPNQNVEVSVVKKEGRGNIRIVQQPNRRNNFTTIIEIDDAGGGARQYQLEIFW